MQSHQPSADNPPKSAPGLGSGSVQLRLLLALAILAGGGGVGAGLANLAVQLGAIAVLAANPGAVTLFLRESPRGFLALVLASLALPLLQLVPLPPALWQALPGREVVRQSFALVGREDAWFPFSLDPARTTTAALALLPPLAVLVLAAALGKRARRDALALIVWLALASVLLGAVQVLTENRWGNLWPGAEGPVLFGFFANRNTTAPFLAICAALALFVDWGERRGLRGAGGAIVAALLIFGAVLTQSRAGIALCGLVVMLKLASLAMGGKDGRVVSFVLAGAAALVGALALAATANQRLAGILARFSGGEENRLEIWQDTAASIARFWPLGSGQGTFDEVFQLDESLENLFALKAGRAHNDYLEIGVEAGALGLLLVAAWLGGTVWRGWKLRAEREAGAGMARAALVGLAIVAGSSLVDYPLRNETMLCLAALLAAILADPRHASGEPRAHEQSSRGS